MTDNILSLKLLQLAYHELNDEEAIAVQALIASDEKIRKEWFDIQTAMEYMDLRLAKPSESSVQQVLEKLKSHNPLESL